ncbi:MAG TPA: serine/threonine-protein phosphatase [Candidatus Accumulibacter sp.]|nr:serine/threonine-protein phosphatase [Accumulibacter sp.]
MRLFPALRPVCTSHRFARAGGGNRMTKREQALRRSLWTGHPGNMVGAGAPASEPRGVLATGYRVEACMESHIGRVRSSNQDSLGFVCPADATQLRDRGVLVMIADGMGGHNAGEIASAMAVEVLCRSYFEGADADPGDALAAAMRQANEVILLAAATDSALAGMGTTATALVLVDSLVLFAHVGDSRLYRCRGGRCRQLTGDQTVAAEMVRSGLLSATQARHHPARHVLVESLGSEQPLRVVTQADAPPLIGEAFVLCSDGLWESVDADEIGHSVSTLDAATACRRLIELALERDGSDNISVAIVSVRPPAPS